MMIILYCVHIQSFSMKILQPKFSTYNTLLKTDTSKIDNHFRSRIITDYCIFSKFCINISIYTEIATKNISINKLTLLPVYMKILMAKELSVTVSKQNSIIIRQMDFKNFCFFIKFS